MPPLYSRLLRDIAACARDDRAIASARFFKTGPGQYGEGDRFRGLTMGDQRRIAKSYRDLGFPDIERLLESPWHEDRMIGLLITVLRYERAENDTERRRVFDFFVEHRSSVNNWDLVDVTTPNIIGDFLLRTKKKRLLHRFARSKNLWERRMAIIATFPCIRNGDFTDTLSLVETLLHDSHDLLHKATGWMLREIGKRDRKTLIRFLETHASRMPRTMLRYAIEKLPRSERHHFLGLRHRDRVRKN